MNSIFVRVAISLLFVILVTVLMSRFGKRELLERMKQSIDWLLEIGYLFFVDILIFLKPLEGHTQAVGLVILALLLGYFGYQFSISSEMHISLKIFAGYTYLISMLYAVKGTMALVYEGKNEEEEN